MKSPKGFAGLPVLIAIILGLIVVGGGTYFVVQKRAAQPAASFTFQNKPISVACVFSFPADAENYSVDLTKCTKNENLSTAQGWYYTGDTQSGYSGYKIDAVDGNTFTVESATDDTYALDYYRSVMKLSDTQLTVVKTLQYINESKKTGGTIAPTIPFPTYATVSTPTAKPNTKQATGTPQKISTVKNTISFQVFGVTPYDTRVMPREMGYYASYPVDWKVTDPHDTSVYTVDYGDGTKGTLKFQGVRCPVDGGGSCMATWTAPSHTFTTAGAYTAVLYKDGAQTATEKFLVFGADIQSSTAAGPAGPSGPSGNLPLTVTFTFTGGTEINFGDGSSQTLCANCMQWSTTQHQIQHTYTTPGYHQMAVKFNGLGMEGAGVSVLSGGVTSISPSSGPIGTKVTVYGSGFTSKGAVNFLSFCNNGNANCANFTLKDFTISNDGSSITFTIPPTYSVNTGTCSSGGGCTTNPPQTHAVPSATYDVGFDDIGFPAELPLRFSVTNQ